MSQSLTLGDYIALPEAAFNNILQAKEALDCLAYLAIEVSNKALGNPHKTDDVTLCAEGLASLLSCISQSISKEGCMLATRLLKNQGV